MKVDWSSVVHINWCSWGLNTLKNKCLSDVIQDSGRSQIDWKDVIKVSTNDRFCTHLRQDAADILRLAARGFSNQFGLPETVSEWSVWCCLMDFYVVKQVPIYISCFRECCNAVLLWSSTNILWNIKLPSTFHQLSGEQVMTESFFFEWTVPLKATRLIFLITNNDTYLFKENHLLYRVCRTSKFLFWNKSFLYS